MGGRAWAAMAKSKGGSGEPPFHQPPDRYFLLEGRRRQSPRETAEAICAAAGAQIKHHATGARVERTRTDDSRERSRQVPEERAARAKGW